MEAITKYDGKWVKLSFTHSGLNQWDKTETQIITKIRFEGTKGILSIKSLIRYGHPCKEDAEESYPWVEDVAWEWQRLEMDLVVKEDEDYDLKSDSWKKAWRLMDDEDIVCIEPLDTTNEEVNKLLMPAPRKVCKRKRTLKF